MVTTDSLGGCYHHTLSLSTSATTTLWIKPAVDGLLRSDEEDADEEG
ncbi:hypothetical protein HanXRQr2_Chr03g0095791 [Helianthus annuus]|uniref:Uncharacterized protein n=1 Tax=Helianthus annuus TaxID=4232 RepID=A0A9K3JE23_HELAN|nr:hypothetical protein HanXRQr2_Chr03g0095791 [Helianthus annuus]KAJ0942476.1 hypothetical protein HanPSC8_Chr03g0092391 [Helianthus annuus]